MSEITEVCNERNKRRPVSEGIRRIALNVREKEFDLQDCGATASM